MNTILLFNMMTVAISAPQQLEGASMADALQLADPGSIRIEGFLGRRIECNRTGRLKHIPMTELLNGFQHRPGKHAWIGEHIGKWLHAAVLTWQYSGDIELKRMIDEAVQNLLATQEKDGYLGTYEDKDRWKSWDVWVHKYNLIGLLTYHRTTNDAAALRGAQRIGDLLIKTFGPNKRDIIAAGTHKGMAATSVLEPMVLLYRTTGDARYLTFCQYLVESWEKPEGAGHAKRPKILSSLLGHGKVNQTANRKAYEMMSNLVGLCKLYRVTLDERYLEAARNAWDDIAANQRYLVGGTSLNEHFQPDGHLPDTGRVAETCANVTWMQLSLALLSLTGDTKYADAVEQLVYNHLLAAQAEDGNDWCYFTVLLGKKRFLQHVNCCHSSGPRGVALIPTAFYGTGTRRLRIHLYGESQFTGAIDGVGSIAIRQKTLYPADGRIIIEVQPDKPATFRLELRIPPWSKNYRLAVNDQPVKATPQALAVINRKWQPGDVVTLDLDVTPKWIRGRGEHEGRLAVRKGPLILCASQRWNPTLPSMMLIGVEGTPGFEEAETTSEGNTQQNGLLTTFKGKIRTPEGLRDVRVFLGPFALVQKEKLAVWLHSMDSLSKLEYSLLFDGTETVSRGGDLQGSIADGDPSTYCVTRYDTLKDSDSWEVTLDQPVKISRVVFRHGHTSHNGGWFDTSDGKPKVFVRTEQDGPWRPVGTLETYPQTTADKLPKLDDGQAFELVISPTKVYGVRVVGKPAYGDDPTQTFSSCAELAAFGI